MSISNSQRAKTKMLAYLASADVVAAKASMIKVMADSSSTPEKKKIAQKAYTQLVKKGLKEFGLAEVS